MKKILFPTDFSDAANNAFIYALKLAKRLDAEVIALHVFALPDIKSRGLSHTLQEFYENVEKDEFVDFTDNLPLLHKIAEDNGLSNIEVTSIMEKDKNPKTAIVRIADREEVDFIVMGTKGASGLREMFIGSVAAEVLENANVPVLSVPDEAMFDGSIDEIAVATDYSEGDDELIMRVLEFANLFNANVSCVNIDTAHTDAYTKRTEEMSRKYAHFPQLSFHVIDESDIKEAISNFVIAHDIDVLAMLTHKRNFFQEFFNFNFSKKLAYSTTVPLLSIQAHTM